MGIAVVFDYFTSKTMGYLVKQSDGTYRAYMSREDAERDRYPVGFGTRGEAVDGIRKIIAEAKAEQDFERRYS